MKSFLFTTWASPIYKNKQDKDIQDFLEIYNVIAQQVCMVDRTGFVKTPYRYHIDQKIPTKPDQFTNPSFSDIAIARAKDILLHNKSVLVCWSGGIDSTSMLTAFIIAADGNTDRIKVVCNGNTIRENPKFYYNHIRDKLVTINSDNLVHFINDERHSIILAEGCDQLFGTDLYKKVQLWDNLESMYKPYSFENIGKFFMDCGMSEHSAKKWFSIMDDQIKEACPVEIIDFKDFLWWYNFCYKWQNVYYRLYYLGNSVALPLTREYLDKNYIQFYMTDDFQLWSMYNPDQKINKDWASYKFTAKQFIYDFDGDKEYLDNKVKVASLINLIRSRSTVCGLNTDLEFLGPDDDVEPYRVLDNSFK